MKNEWSSSEEINESNIYIIYLCIGTREGDERCIGKGTQKKMDE